MNHLFALHRINGELIATGASIKEICETPNIDLKGADLLRADLRWVDLEGKNLEGANLSWANLRGAHLQRARMQFADLGGANLQRANLSRANLQGANLRSADLEWANLQRADMKGADLQGAFLQRADLEDADMSCVKLQRSCLQGALLQKANLQGANLSWTSHNLLCEVLRQHARKKAHYELIGIVFFQPHLCWNDYMAMEHPEKEWALKTLAGYIQPDDGHPPFLDDYKTGGEK